ncbi:hypothetical protein QBC42DRAFT_264439, partial [Cladorrhinum samala]
MGHMDWIFFFFFWILFLEISIPPFLYFSVENFHCQNAIIMTSLIVQIFIPSSEVSQWCFFFLLLLLNAVSGEGGGKKIFFFF